MPRKTQIDPDSLIEILEIIEEELPVLIGLEYWPQIHLQFNDKYSQLLLTEDPITRMQLSADLIGMLSHYDGSREALRRALDPEYAIFTDLARIAPDLGLGEASQRDLFAFAEINNQQRLVIINKNTEEGKSIKLRNFDFDFGEMGGFAAGIIMTCYDIIGSEKPLITAAGILLVAASLYKAITIQIDEPEVGVYLGFINACGANGKTATEDAVLRSTNAEREKNSKRLLDLDDIKDSLHKLAKIKTVKRLKNSQHTWEIIENLYEL